MAEVIRDVVNRLPERDDRAERFTRALEAVRSGRGHDIGGKTHVARRHDEYLADIYAQDLRKR